MAYWPSVQWDSKWIRLEINVYFFLDPGSLLDCCLPRICFSNSFALGTKLQLWSSGICWKGMGFKAMLVAPVRPLVPFSRQCQGRVGDGSQECDLCSYPWGDCQDNRGNFLMYFEQGDELGENLSSFVGEIQHAQSSDLYSSFNGMKSARPHPLCCPVRGSGKRHFSLSLPSLLSHLLRSQTRSLPRAPPPRLQRGGAPAVTTSGPSGLCLG